MAKAALGLCNVSEIPHLRPWRGDGCYILDHLDHNHDYLTTSDV